MIRAADALAHIRRLELPGYGDDEVTFIAKTVLKLEPDAIFEWGTNVGASARIFREITRLAGLRTIVHTVELADPTAHRDHPGHRYAQHVRGLADVVLHQGDGVTVATAEYHRLLPARALFFLDGDHDTQAVHRELELVTAVAPRAVVLVHDTCGTAGVGVDRFLSGDAGERYRVDFLPSQAGLTRLWPTPSV